MEIVIVILASLAGVGHVYFLFRSFSISNARIKELEQENLLQKEKELLMREIAYHYFQFTLLRQDKNGPSIFREKLNCHNDKFIEKMKEYQEKYMSELNTE